MYTDFYRLTAKPFQLGANPGFYYGSKGHQRALAYLQYGLHQGEGFVVITGDIGTGKTTLLGHLLAQIDPEKYLAAKLVTTQIEADDTLRMVASAYGLETQGVDKSTLLRKFEYLLQDNAARGRRLLVLVDEVQNMPVKSLEELRMLSNFQTAHVSPIQFCLLGQPQFREIIARDELQQLRQRVISSYHLGPLDPDETRAYVEHRLQMVGWANDPHLTEAAYAHIHLSTGGVPRRINVLCDRILVCGMLEELHEIDETIAIRVANELDEENLGLTDGAVEEPSRAALRTWPSSANNSVDALSDRIARMEKRLAVQEKVIKEVIRLASSAFVSRPVAAAPRAVTSETESAA